MREDERAELFFEAKPFSVVLQDGARRGILIHRNVLTAKGAWDHLDDGERLRPLRPAQAEPDARSVLTIDKVARLRIPRDGYPLPSAGAGERFSPPVHAASPKSA